MTSPLSARSTRSYTTLAVAIVVAAVIISATLFAALRGASTSTKTVPETVTTTETATVTTTLDETSTSTTRTCTMVTPEFQHCPLQLGFTDSFGQWNYTVTVNSTSIERGQTIQLVATLTNCRSCENVTIGSFVEPFINPVIYASNGTELWSWNPPETTYSNFVFPGGQTITQSMDIPTLKFQAGHSYQLNVVPDFMTIENNVSTMTLQFSVTPPATTTTSTPTSTITGPTQVIYLPVGVGTETSLSFVPGSVTVAPGTTIVFINNDTRNIHNVDFTSVPSGATIPTNPSTDTDKWANNEYSVTLTVAGTYHYRCDYHSWMVGTITVS